MNKLLITISLLCFMYVCKPQVATPPHGGMPYPDPMQPIPNAHKPCTRCWPKIKDTMPPSFRDIVFLVQQNVELSQRLDRVESANSNLSDSIDELRHELSILWWITRNNAVYRTGWQDSIENKLNSIDRRPIIYIDTLQKELWVKCPDGSCDIFIRKLQ